MFTLHTHMIKNKRGRDRDEETCLPKKCVLSGNHLCTGQFSVPEVFFLWQRRSKISGVLRHTFKTTKWPFTFWIKCTKSRLKENVWEPPPPKKKKETPKVTRSHVFLLIIQYPSTRVVVATLWDLHHFGLKCFRGAHLCINRCHDSPSCTGKRPWRPSIHHILNQ